jgi:DNA helicase-2/ATP-dependent DNA helicase PcrA
MPGPVAAPALSEPQARVVAHRGADLQVIACAGAGKTESMARRIAALVGEGVAPSAIVAFTFTERAARELRDRITRRVTDQLGRGWRDRLSPLFVGTIHSFCLRILQTHVSRYDDFDVLDEHRHAAFLSREYHRLGLGTLSRKHWQPVRDFARTADVISNEHIRPEQLGESALGTCYRAYRDLLSRYRLFTFGQLVTLAVEALEDPGVLGKVRAGLAHLLVDEYQDINPVQQALIDLLAQPPVELTVVGDDDQSIYQWRGADVRNILTFRDRRPHSARFTLADNRRSRPGIIHAAGAFALTIPNRLDKSMQPTRPAAEPTVVCWQAETDTQEAERLADTIVRLHDHGFPYRDIAVLFRSVRTSAPPLIEALRDRGVPFSCGGRTGLFLQPDASLLGEIFAWFVDGDWRDERFGEFRKADVDHVVAGLERQFGDGSPIEGLKQYLLDWRSWHARGARPVNLLDDYYRLLHLLGAHRLDPDTPEGSARLGALARFGEVLGDFEHVFRRGRQVTDSEGRPRFEAARDRGRDYFRALYNYLLHYARDAYEDFAGEENAALDAVSVLTIHQAKGLEWPVVFLPSLVEGRFPSRLAGTAQSWLLREDVFPPTTRARYEGGDAEERRLFYVALTRARECVYLSAFQRKTNQFRASPYLLEVAGSWPPVDVALPLPAPPPARQVDNSAPVDVSYSDLATFEDCGYRYRLANVFGFQAPLAPELGYGRALHHVLREVAEFVVANGRAPDETTLERLLADTMFVPFASAQAWETMRDSARRLVVRYLAEHAEELTRVWGVERPFSLYLDEGVVRGRADVVLDREAGTPGRLAVVDYKVSHDEGREARYREQLVVYTAAGRAEGLDVHAAYLHELKDGSRYPVDVNPPAVTTAVTRLGSQLARLAAGEFTPATDVARCATCEQRLVCRHVPAPGPEA